MQSGVPCYFLIFFDKFSLSFAYFLEAEKDYKPLFHQFYLIHSLAVASLNDYPQEYTLWN